MDVEICEEPMSHLAEHSRVSIAFEVDRVLDLTAQDAGLGGPVLLERPLPTPYLKDYDAITGNHPTEWERRFDLSNWSLLTARIEGNRVGGVVIAFKTSGLHMLEDRGNLAVVWDLRVSPELRRRRVVSALLAAAEEWARQRGCRQLKVETQNNNVTACKFYASQGFELGAIHRFVYPELPKEVQLIWYKDVLRRV